PVASLRGQRAPNSRDRVATRLPARRSRPDERFPWLAISSTRPRWPFSRRLQSQQASRMAGAVPSGADRSWPAEPTSSASPVTYALQSRRRQMLLLPSAMRVRPPASRFLTCRQRSDKHAAREWVAGAIQEARFVPVASGLHHALENQ